MQKITPYLWFDKEAVEASEFYTSVFPDSKVVFTQKMSGTLSGNVDIVGFRIMGYDFMAISAGSVFKINPSISVIVNFDSLWDKDARQKIDEIWKKLAEGGKALMLLDKYSFSERYGWIQDKYGFSWQLIYTSPEAEQCGWVKDKYGVSWQIVPANMGELMSNNPKKTTSIMLKMKKIIISDLERAGRE